MDEWVPMIDIEDYFISNKGQVYSVKKTIILTCNGNSVMIKSKPYNLARLVCKHFHKDWDEKLKVHHIDDNNHNNQIENLQMVSVNQTQWKLINNNDGICKWNKGKCYRYTSCIIIKEKRHDLGKFDTEEEASEAYNDMAEYYHLDFYKMASV